MKVTMKAGLVDRDLPDGVMKVGCKSESFEGEYNPVGFIHFIIGEKTYAVYLEVWDGKVQYQIYDDLDGVEGDPVQMGILGEYSNG